MKLGIVIVQYNKAEVTTRCLESLFEQLDDMSRIFVIENGSSAVEKETLKTYLARKSDNIRLIETATNLGFSGGVNIGIKAALEDGSDWILLLNNDTSTGSDFIQKVRAKLGEADEGLLGLALNEGGRTAYAGIIRWLKISLNHIYSQDGLKYPDDKYPVGGAVLIRKWVFEKIGYFDEKYFLYFEDADFAQRARRAGIKIGYIPDIQIEHLLGASAKTLGAPLLLRYHARNALRFNFKNGPLFIKILALIGGVIVWLKQLVKVLAGINPAESKAIMRGISDFYTNRWGKIDSKIKVGIECRSIEERYGSWGVGRIITKLIEEISLRPDLKDEFNFILYFKDEIPRFKFLDNPVFIIKKVPVPLVPNRLFPIYYFALLPLKIWFEKLHVMFWPNYMLPIIAWGSKNLVTLTEDVYHETHAKKLPFRYRLAYWIFGNWTAKFADRVVAISESSKKEVAKLYKIRPERIVVNTLGIDIRKDSEGITPPTQKYFLYVGQAFPRRHLKETMEAFGKFAADFPDYHLLAIGVDKYETPTISKLKQTINAGLGREAIIHKDYISEDELIGLYKNAAALIYISFQEAFGLPPVEAWAYGTPAIVANIPVTHEIFGDNAFFVDNPAVETIAKAMKEAIESPEKVAAIRSAGEKISEKYTWSKHTDRFLDIIRDMAKN